MADVEVDQQARRVDQLNAGRRGVLVVFVLLMVILSVFTRRNGCAGMGSHRRCAGGGAGLWIGAGRTVVLWCDTRCTRKAGATGIYRWSCGWVVILRAMASVAAPNAPAVAPQVGRQRMTLSEVRRMRTMPVPVGTQRLHVVASDPERDEGPHGARAFLRGWAVWVVLAGSDPSGGSGGE